MRDFIKQCRSYFLYAGIFSLFINLLVLTVPLHMLQVYDRVLASRSQETLWLLTLIATIALLLCWCLDTLRSRLLLSAGVALDGLAAGPVLAGVFRQAGKAGGTQYAHGLKDISTLRAYLSGAGIVSLFDAPWLPLYVGLIFVFHWKLGVIAATGAMMLVALAWLNEKFTRQPLTAMNDAARRTARYIDAGVRNAEIVNALGMVDAIRTQWQRLNNTVIDSQVAANRTGGLFSGAAKFVRLFIQILMLAVGALIVIDGQASAGVMIAATLVLSRALAPAENAIITWKSLVEARDAYRRLAQLLLANTVVANQLKLPRPAGTLELERVVYAPPGSDRNIIKGISLMVPPGRSLGVIGSSGSGKSTLARLMTGLQRPQAGVVRLDGADIGLWPREHLGPHIGYLPQDVQLFAGTVAENIARLAEATPEAIVGAAQRARAHDMILRLPQGYDTQIGEGGSLLSGGQRQRVALARALLGDPQLVILDEPNANLDSDGEDALRDVMTELSQHGVTCVVISHRPSLLASVDLLLMMKDGLVELFGPRAEVMARVTRAAPIAIQPVTHIAQGGRVA